MSEGFVGAATILEIISRKHNVYPNLATVFLDVDFAHADFQDRYLRSSWGTVTRRMRRLLTKESVRCFTGSDFTAKDIITSKTPITVYFHALLTVLKKWTFAHPMTRGASGRHVFEANVNRFALLLQVHG